MNALTPICDAYYSLNCHMYSSRNSSKGVSDLAEYTTMESAFDTQQEIAIFASPRFQAGSGTHSASHPEGAGSYFLGDKATWV